MSRSGPSGFRDLQGAPPGKAGRSDTSAMGTSAMNKEGLEKCAHRCYIGGAVDVIVVSYDILHSSDVCAFATDDGWSAVRFPNGKHPSGNVSYEHVC